MNDDDAGSRPSPPSADDATKQRPHILVIGAGIIGLTLAQALRKRHPGLKTTVYERDANASTRGAGWGLTIHWALAAFQELLPSELLERLEETFVDPVAARLGDGSFTFLDLRTGQKRWCVPPGRRIRVRRESLRRLLMEGVDIKWSKRIVSITNNAGGTVTAHFADSSTVTGTLLVGCDGSRSRVRQIICPSSYENTKLPVRLLSVSVSYPSPLAETIRELDPFFFQGGDSETDAFLWFSFLDTPSSHRDGREEYTCQILISWPYRSGFLSERCPVDVPSTIQERVAFMKRLAKDWVDPMRAMVMNIPDDADVKAISLEDWPPPKVSRGVDVIWDHFGDRVTLAGDAAHAMVMYRGEAANHGIVDVSSLMSQLSPYLTRLSSSSSPATSMTQPSKPLTPVSLHSTDSEENESQLNRQDHQPDSDNSDGRSKDDEDDHLAQMISRYEIEMITRTRPAVLASRRACLDAHDYRRIDERSPLISKRAIVVDDC